MLDCGIAQIPDVQADPEFRYLSIATAVAYRSVVAVPMLRDNKPIGGILVAQAPAGSFPDRQLELLQTFAGQAIIAIENVRLFQELETRNRDIARALEQQTATAEVLKVISRATFDLAPVLETVIENATKLCDAGAGVIYRFDGGILRVAVGYHVSPEFRDFVLRTQSELHLSRGSGAGRAAIERRTIHIPDVLADPEYEMTEAQKVGGFRTLLSVPMLREQGNQVVGVMSMLRNKVEAFTDQQIDLVTSFADQAVIAIENVRLFQELESRSRELARSVEQLTALGEVGQAVSSTLDLDTVLETIVSRAVQLSASFSGIIYEFDAATQSFHARASHRISPQHLAALKDPTFAAITVFGDTTDDRWT